MLVISVFSLSNVHLQSKRHLSNRFATLFYPQPFNEMFIFTSLSSCCIGMFTNVRFYVAANKEYLTKIQIISDVYIQHSCSYIV